MRHAPDSMGGMEAVAPEVGSDSWWAQTKARMIVATMRERLCVPLVTEPDAEHEAA